jgi:flagellar basal-body rod modification protein FlgD
MGELIQPVKEGKIVQTKNDKADTKPKNNLDKNAFLQLLTTQMKYQDPLNPNTDTEYIAQLATFSQLEQLQNLSSITTNTQAFNLVGKEVTVKTENSSGDITYINGRVDFVTMTGKDTKISINGSLYSIDQLDSVISSEYITEQNLPNILQKTELKYDAAIPKDQSFEVKLGSGETIADDVAVIINEQVIDDKLVDVKAGKVTIKKEALENLDNGNYKLIIAFNDPMLTTIKDKVTLQVVNAVPKENDGSDQPEASDTGQQ